MRRRQRAVQGFAARHRVHAIALDAGIDTVRVWPAGDELAEFATPVGVARSGEPRTRATASIIEAARYPIRRRLPPLTRRRRHGFRVAVTVPACATQSDRRRVERAVHLLNRDQPVLLMETPLAAATGVGVDVAAAAVPIVLDVGVHGSEAALVAEGRIIDALGCTSGSHHIEHAVVTHLFRRHHVLATPAMAWQALRLGAAVIDGPDGDAPVALPLSPAELAVEISDPTAAIVNLVRRLSDRATTLLDRDPLERGLVLVGGGALFPQLARTLRAELHAPVIVPREPRRAAIRGVARLLSEAERYPRLWDS